MTGLSQSSDPIPCNSDAFETYTDSLRHTGESFQLQQLREVERAPYNYITTSPLYTVLPLWNLPWGWVGYGSTRYERQLLRLGNKIEQMVKFDTTQAFWSYAILDLFDYMHLEQRVLMDSLLLRNYQDSVLGKVKPKLTNDDEIRKITLEFRRYQNTFFSSGTYDLLKTFRDMTYAMHGPVRKQDILASEKSGDSEILLYLDQAYENGELGYWIALTRDGGNTWSQYYTGLTEHYYYYVRRNNHRKIWVNDSVAQFPASILRMIEPGGSPGPPEKFESVRDILLRISLPGIQKDSDGDGLTDVVELKFMLDPTQKDTDGDSINDLYDTNPRYRSLRSRKGQVYEAIIDSQLSLLDTTYIPWKDSVQSNLTKQQIDSPALIVTDDPILKHVEPTKRRVIILTPEEYEQYKGQYPCTLYHLMISPLFPCDNERSMYRIIIDGAQSMRVEYIIQMMESGFRAYCESVTIS